jgi:hypothetical protein
MLQQLLPGLATLEAGARFEGEDSHGALAATSYLDLTTAITLCLSQGTVPPLRRSVNLQCSSWVVDSATSAVTSPENG